MVDDELYPWTGALSGWAVPGSRARRPHDAAMLLERRQALITAGCLGVLYTVWGSTYLAQRLALASFPPLFMGGSRFLLAGIPLYVALRLRGAVAPTWSEQRAAALAAAPLMVFGMGGAAIALQRVPSGLAALVFASVPLWTSLFDWLCGGTLRRVEIAGLVLGLAGVVVVSTRGALAADPAGAMMIVAAAASYAFGCVATRRLALPRGALGTASQMIAGGVMLLLGSAARGERVVVPSGAALVALAYLVVFGSMLGYSALGYLLRSARPALATSYAYVNPIVALGLGAALAGERVTHADLGGLALVLTAVALVALGSRSGSPSQSSAAATTRVLPTAARGRANRVA
jgi:drug/metabolite transporter (DMT)-like permease